MSKPKLTCKSLEDIAHALAGFSPDLFVNATLDLPPSMYLQLYREVFPGKPSYAVRAFGYTCYSGDITVVCRDIRTPEIAYVSCQSAKNS